jgi:UDP-glucuronate 4-epimerase
MANYRFADAIARGRPIDVYNHGRMSRDYTYNDDIVEGVVRIAERPPTSTTTAGFGADGDESAAPASLYNIGNNRPVELERLISLVEAALGKTAIRNTREMQPGDMLTTYADIDPLFQATGFRPAVSIEAGIAKFVDWYLNYQSRANDRAARSVPSR